MPLDLVPGQLFDALVGPVDGNLRVCVAPHSSYRPGKPHD